MPPSEAKHVVAKVLACLSLLASGTVSHAAVYWNQGVRSAVVTVCFVGDAVTARPVRVQQILDYIAHYQWIANVRFDFLGTCPAPTKQPNGDDYYDGDIRVVIPSTNIDATVQVPGKGCPAGSNGGWGSWSNAPDDLANNRGCLYNLKLGDDPWNATPYLNHTLHEFGHALGLAHEHERNDVDRTICSEAGFGGGITTGFLTPYDRHSVMHYMFVSCAINGNYDYTGLASRDALAGHMLYPETQRTAEFFGTTVLPSSQDLVLSFAWSLRGANTTSVATNFRWAVDGTTVSNQANVRVRIAPGDRTLEFSYLDFLGRDYYYIGSVRVMEPAAFTRRISGPVAARSILM